MCCFEALQVIQPKAISWMIFSIIPPAAESLIIITIHCTVGAGLSSENEEYMPFCAFYFQYGYSASAIDHDFNVAQSTPIMSTWSDLPHPTVNCVQLLTTMLILFPPV